MPPSLTCTPGGTKRRWRACRRQSPSPSAAVALRRGRSPATSAVSSSPRPTRLQPSSTSRRPQRLLRTRRGAWLLSGDFSGPFRSASRRGQTADVIGQSPTGLDVVVRVPSPATPGRLPRTRAAANQSGASTPAQCGWSCHHPKMHNWRLREQPADEKWLGQLRPSHPHAEWLDPCRRALAYSP